MLFDRQNSSARSVKLNGVHLFVGGSGESGHKLESVPFWAGLLFVTKLKYSYLK